MEKHIWQLCCKGVLETRGKAGRINKLIAGQLSEEDFNGITNPKLSFNKDRSDMPDHMPASARSVLHVIEKPDEDK